MSYFDYKKGLSFQKEYDEINLYCKKIGIDWSASAWDTESIKFLNNYKLPFIKVPSDKCSDIDFIHALKQQIFR